MYRTVTAIALSLAFWPLPAAGQAPTASDGYGAAWYRAEGWSGEYPNGFTMVENARLTLRESPNLSAPATVACEFPVTATYHPWNEARVASDGLQFLSFTRIQDYEITAPLEAVVYDDAAVEKLVNFAPGERWTFLLYHAEGYFLMRYRDVEYQAGQELFEVSKPLGREFEPADSYHEWLGMTCDGRTGWLFRAEIEGNPAFGGPNITEYGIALDASR